MKKEIPVNDVGRVIGEAHYKSKLSDEQVEQIRNLYEEGHVGYRTLAKTFGVSRHTIKSIVLYERRCATPSRWIVRSEK